MKRLLKTIVFLLFFLSIIIGTLVYSTYVSPEKLQISYTSLKSPAIGEQLNDLEIGYFSDIHYNGFMDKERFDKMIKGMVDANVDLVLFGGDLFDPGKGLPTEEQQQELISQLKQLQASLGKFAVLGANDNSSEEMRLISRNVLLAADFELLDNQSIYIRKGGDQSIRILGIDSTVNGNPDVIQAFDDIKPSDYNIVLSHSPNLINDSSFVKQSISLFLSGNGFTNQIKLPILGVVGDKVGHDQYNSGIHNDNNMKLIISNGIGTLGTDIRLFLPPTFYVLRLQNVEETLINP